MKNNHARIIFFEGERIDLLTLHKKDKLISFLYSVQKSIKEILEGRTQKKIITFVLIDECEKA